MGRSIDRPNDIAAAVSGTDRLGDKQVIGTEAASPEVIGPDRAPVAVEQNVRVVLRNAQAFSLSDRNAALRRTCPAPGKFHRRSVLTGARRRCGASGKKSDREENPGFHVPVLLLVAPSENALPCLLVPALL